MLLEVVGLYEVLAPAKGHIFHSGTISSGYELLYELDTLFHSSLDSLNWRPFVSDVHGHSECLAASRSSMKCSLQAKGHIFHSGTMSY